MQGPGRFVLTACAGTDEPEMRALMTARACQMTGPERAAALIFISSDLRRTGYVRRVAQGRRSHGKWMRRQR
jgi:hypothetical protein